LGRASGVRHGTPRAGKCSGSAGGPGWGGGEKEERTRWGGGVAKAWQRSHTAFWAMIKDFGLHLKKSE
jgi:hypothetical protein